MVVRYFDKDGKEHRLNLKTNQPVFIASEIDKTGEFAEFRVEESIHYNESVMDWTTSGKITVGVASQSGMTLYPKSNGLIEIGPSK